MASQRDSEGFRTKDLLGLKVHETAIDSNGEDHREFRGHHCSHDQYTSEKQLVSISVRVLQALVEHIA